jgi:hypothetical protein
MTKKKRYKRYSPELYDAFFGNYRRLDFLSQIRNEDLLAAAQDAAERLALDFEHVHCGYGKLESGLHDFTASKADG